MKNQFFVILGLSAFVVHCSIDSSGIGTVTESTSSSGTGSGGSDIVGDAFPPGAVAYFRKTACPTDWEFFPAAHGRAMIAASDGLPRGTLMGEPLEMGEDREHVHTMNAMVDVPATQIAGIEGGGNDGMTPAGMNAFVGNSSAAKAGVPYIRYLTCKKSKDAAPQALPLPSKLLSYFDLDVCPSGWKKSAIAEGRLIVGRPGDAPADLPFGGDNITTPDAPMHSHGFESSFDTNSHGVALASGCCGTFGKNGSVAIAGETDPAQIDIPMIAMLQCEKE